MRPRCANRVRPGASGVHYSLRLPTLECDHFDLTSDRGDGVAEQFGRFQFSPGELGLGDAGYCHPAGIAAVVDGQADVCVRLNLLGVSLRNTDDRRFDLLERLAALAKPGDMADWPAQVRLGERRIAGRVCAIRKSQGAIDRAQRCLDRKWQRGQKVVANT